MLSVNLLPAGTGPQQLYLAAAMARDQKKRPACFQAGRLLNRVDVLLLKQR